MTSLNHAMTGALVAVAIKQPAVALPAAFLSHFVIDALPHWDYLEHGNQKVRRFIIGADQFVSGLMCLLLAITLPDNGWLVLAGGFLGIAPDLMWLPYILYGKPSPSKNNSWLHKARRFHSKIQLSETPKGVWFEAVWFVLVVWLLVKIV